MNPFTIEHSKTAYCADFAAYAVVVLILSAAVVVLCPYERWLGSAALVLLGFVGWSIVEYVIHRFVLHGLSPFCQWHAEHHARPLALISAPTVLSGALIATLVFLPAYLLGGRWAAMALTLGVLAGYLAYAAAHHATHHWQPASKWSRQRKLWHALHHRHAQEGCCYGVSTDLWDHVFGSTARRLSIRETAGCRCGPLHRRDEGRP
jgi:sterol desaturase/sphingolipid hydroxylase (fatty acid hydroxylase superfamily)